MHNWDTNTSTQPIDFVNNFHTRFAKNFIGSLVAYMTAACSVPSQRPSVLKRGIVAAPERRAVEIGTGILREDGTVVANTDTLNDSYGFGVGMRGTGIFFSIKPGVPNLFGVSDPRGVGCVAHE